MQMFARGAESSGARLKCLVGGGHVESEGGFLAQDSSLCGKVMPTIRKVGGTALAKPEASASATESCGTVASLDLLTAGYRQVNVAGRVVFVSGIGASYPQLQFKISDGCGTLLIKCSGGRLPSVSIDACIYVRNLVIRQGIAGLEGAYETPQPDAKRVRRTSGMSSLGLVSLWGAFGGRCEMT